MTLIKNIIFAISKKLFGLKTKTIPKIKIKSAIKLLKHKLKTATQFKIVVNNTPKKILSNLIFLFKIFAHAQKIIKSMTKVTRKNRSP